MKNRQMAHTSNPSAGKMETGGSDKNKLHNSNTQWYGAE